MPDDHYFSAAPSATSRPQELELTLPDVHLTLVADRGVFSARAVDPGTVEFLKAVPPPPPEGHLLDLGCGYGPIACTLALRAPRATVWALDVNERALSLTASNAKRNGAPNVRAVTSADIPADVTFSGIWSNPPIRIGKPALHALLEGWLARLVPGGFAWLVVHHHLGGDSLARWLDAQGWVTSKVSSRKGYRIMKVAAR
ncbi:MAG TPA: methyltransferase [Acidimicrobiales bacterium]|nr:methyltransferase [Acidimicrobiales bacterium]